VNAQLQQSLTGYEHENAVDVPGGGG